MDDDAWELVSEGKEYRFCLLRVDIVDNTRISKASATGAAQETFDEFFKDLEGRVAAQGGKKWSRDGDGGLFAFYSSKPSLMAEHAVAAAINIMENLETFNRAKNKLAAPIRIRAAVHLGLIQFSKDPGTVASDEINFVTKLEKEATSPDSISISDTVYRELGNDARERFRALSRYKDTNVWAPGVKRTGEAYILLEVEPGASDAVASQLVRLDRAVAYAAAVWGPWDVIARVTMNRYEDLLLFIDRLRTELSKVRRTETWCVRNDQPHYETSKQADRLAFVMLRIDPSQATPQVVLSDLCRSAEQEGIQVRHVAGVLGPYDVAATVYYDNDSALRSLVMGSFQEKRAVKDTLTIPSIEGMVYSATK
jgi:class 3 adenylate cyclase